MQKLLLTLLFISTFSVLTHAQTDSSAAPISIISVQRPSVEIPEKQPLTELAEQPLEIKTVVRKEKVKVPDTPPAVAAADTAITHTATTETPEQQKALRKIKAATWLGVGSIVILLFNLLYAGPVFLIGLALGITALIMALRNRKLVPATKRWKATVALVLGILGGLVLPIAILLFIVYVVSIVGEGMKDFN